jgi:hypothetical protein
MTGPPAGSVAKSSPTVVTAWPGGSWRAPSGRRYRAEACEGHRPALDKGSGPAA